ncbi:MAG: hypothetical protein DMF84_06630 [Acidobacteria bacterium]|nr:MAG: hypothetical protein DMF84_06630 [Acidobacteriota bacterium]
MAILAAVAAIVCLCASGVLAQDNEEVAAITARVHGTFVDKAGGLGVLSADMSIIRFEVRNGTVTAIGRIEGALADSTGDVLGKVKKELALPVAGVASTCNQLRMDLAATDADILDTPVHFDREVAGFDSRDGARPKALGALCAAARLLQEKPAVDSVARALNDIAIAVKNEATRR